jgi:hypothetical protein
MLRINPQGRREREKVHRPLVDTIEILDQVLPEV